MQTANRYSDRTQAGQVLATELFSVAHRPEVVVLGLARGGVPVAAEIARTLHVDFDVFPVRKLQVPDNPELAFGVVAPDSVHVLDNARVRQLGLTPDELADQVFAAEAALAAQARRYWEHGSPLPLEGKRIILADDGAASDWTLRAAIAALRTRSPRQIIVAVPVGERSACAELAQVCDRLICPLQPEPFLATGLWYVHFAPVTDDEVLEWMEAAHATRTPGGGLNFFR